MRELIWLIVAVLFGYIVFQIYRVWRLGKPAAARRPLERTGPGFDEPTASSLPSENSAHGEAVDASRLDDDEVFVFESSSLPPRAVEPPPAPDDRFQTELAIKQLRQEMAVMRAAADEQAARLAACEAALQAMKEQFEALLTAQSVSPEYNEALVFARRGLDVEAIAERCGISVAEAELVRSLARRGAAQTEEK